MENIVKVTKILNSFGHVNNVFLVQDIDVYELIIKSIAVIVLTSTIGYEAKFFDKPLVCFEFSKDISWLPFTKNGDAFKVNHQEELYNVLKQIINGKNMQNNSNNYYLERNQNALNIISSNIQIK